MGEGSNSSKIRGNCPYLTLEGTLMCQGPGEMVMSYHELSSPWEVAQFTPETALFMGFSFAMLLHLTESFHFLQTSSTILKPETCAANHKEQRGQSFCSQSQLSPICRRKFTHCQKQKPMREPPLKLELNSKGHLFPKNQEDACGCQAKELV